MRLNDIQEHTEVFELDTPERLGENVGDHIFGRTVFDYDVTLGDGLMNEVKVNIDVFHSSMELGVLGELDGTLVVAVKGVL